MTVIKINAITVPDDSGDELARRCAARAGAVDDQDGFEGFELLRPTDERRQWLVVTRWRDDASFQSWVSSPAFAHGHAGADRPSPHGGLVSVSPELRSYEGAGCSDPRSAGRPALAPRRAGLGLVGAVVLRGRRGFGPGQRRLRSPAAPPSRRSGSAAWP